MSLTALCLLAGLLLLLGVTGSSRRHAWLTAREGAGDGPGSEVLDLLVAWMWTAAWAVVVIASAVGVERWVVTDDELDGAIERGVARVEGTLFDNSTGAVEAAIEDELGREVNLQPIDYDDPDESRYTDYYVVGVGEGPDNDALADYEDGERVGCVLVSISTTADVVEPTYLDAGCPPDE